MEAYGLRGLEPPNIKFFFHVLLDDEEVRVSNVKFWLLFKWSTSLNFIRKALPFRRFFQDFENFTVAVVNVLSQLHRITKYRNCPDHLNLREFLFPNTMKRNSVLISFFLRQKSIVNAVCDHLFTTDQSFDSYQLKMAKQITLTV